jgi:molybdopterin converting factor subunit 1
VKLRVKLFAVARERAGTGCLEIELPDETSVGQLRRAIAEQHPSLADVLPHVRFAVNNDYAGDGERIPAAAEVAIIPPVSGG